MHLHLLTLTNVRQFAKRTFEFYPGFNLLVGENGAGKTTILRGLLATIASARQMGKRPRLEDNDIRLHTNLAEVRAVVCHTDGKSEEYKLQKALFKPATRPAHRGKHPLILLYSSNEAICSAMKMKSTKRIQGFNKDSFRRSEEFLYTSEMEPPQKNMEGRERRFGNSQSVRNFVSRILTTFSPDMGDFYWRFEPYDCSIIPPENSDNLKIYDELKKQAQFYVMRYFEEEMSWRKEPFNWPDQVKVILTPNGSENKSLPRLHEIWKNMRLQPSARELLFPCSLEIKLTPRIMLKREIGTLSLHQLSDGEKRLFSLFVDITRQLSINNKNDDIGKGEAIILIDEVDVHLHPKWQRKIVPALEDLLPNCQFIATTHSPFVIQATSREKITSITPRFSTVPSGNNSIEDIVEEIQGVSIPQRSVRAEKLSDAANKYFHLLELLAADKKRVVPAELRAAELSYRDASEPFTSDPAIHALLKVMESKNK